MSKANSLNASKSSHQGRWQPHNESTSAHVFSIRGASLILTSWLLLAGVCLSAAAANRLGEGVESAKEADRILTGGHRFDTEQKAFVENQAIAIRDGRIVAFDEAAEQLDAPIRTQLSDETYILPGIVDLHAHYNVRLLRIRREEFDVNPVLYLANGVTTTFTAGEYDPEGMLELKQQIENGTRIGPRILNAGPYFGNARPGWRRQPPSAEQIKREVNYWADQGVGGFKAKLIDPKSLAVLIEAAHERDLTVTGHLESGYRNSTNPADAIELGIDRVEHFLGGDGLDRTRAAYPSVAKLTPENPDFKEIVKLYVETETDYDATINAFGYFGARGPEFESWVDESEFLTPYIKERLANNEYRPNELFESVYQAKQAMILPFFEAGGRITLGTDHFSTGDFVSGFCAHREMETLARAGIPIEDVIKISSYNGARAMGLEGETGSITIGKLADFYTVQNNPLEDIKRTRAVEVVYRQGVPYDAKELLESVKGKLGPKSAEEADQW